MVRGYDKVAVTVGQCLGSTLLRPHCARDFVRCLRAAYIRSVLDIGTGTGAFLRAMAPAALNAGINLTGLDVDFEPFARHAMRHLGIRTVQGDAEDLGRHFDTERFDIIMAVGLFSTGTLAAPMCARALRSDLTVNRIETIRDKHHRVLAACLDQLSDHPQAMVAACAPTTFLVLSPERVRYQAEVLCWELEARKYTTRWIQTRLDRYAQAYSLSAPERASHEQLWWGGADIAVLQRRGGLNVEGRVRGDRKLS